MRAVKKRVMYLIIRKQYKLEPNTATWALNFTQDSASRLHRSLGFVWRFLSILVNLIKEIL